MATARLGKPVFKTDLRFGRTRSNIVFSLTKTHGALGKLHEREPRLG
jgi:hypothetical protein